MRECECLWYDSSKKGLSPCQGHGCHAVTIVAIFVLLIGALMFSAPLASDDLDADTETLIVDNLKFMVTGDDVILSGYSSTPSGKLIIPDTVSNGDYEYPVVLIADYVFDGCSSISEVIIPNSVKSIGSHAFDGCTGLTTLTFESGSGLTSIGDSAFHDCTSITGMISLPSRLSSIGSGAFYGCSSLTSILIPTSLTTVPANAFTGCTKVTAVHFGSPDTTVTEDAFRSLATDIGTSECVIYGIDENKFGTHTETGTLSFINGSKATLTYDRNNGSDTPMTTTTASTVGAVYIITDIPSEWTRDGYVFGGWSLNSNTYLPGDNIVVPSEAVTLKAVWNKTHTVTWSNGNNILSSDTLVEGTVPSYNGNAPSKTSDSMYSYTFIGWSTTDGGSVLSPLPKITADVTYYATFQSNLQSYKLEFLDGVGGTISSVTLEYGSTVTAPADPTRQGYIFTGWDRAIPTTMPAENVTITAEWKVDPDSPSEFYNWVSNDDGTHTGTHKEDSTLTVTENCSGGTATCCDAAVCILCNGSYGTKDADNHTGGTEIRNAVEETSYTDGYTGDTYCLGCKNLISKGTVIKALPSPSEDGWDTIRDDLAKLAQEIKDGKVEAGRTVTIDMGTVTVVPKDVLKQISGVDVNLRFNMGDDISWNVNGKGVSQDPSDLQLGVKKVSDVVPADLIEIVSPGSTSVQFELEHDGDFGTTIYLYVDLGLKNAGLWANLYYYDGTILEFRHAHQITEIGDAEFPFGHASDYVIIISEGSLEPEPSNGDGGLLYGVILVVLVALAGFSAISFLRGGN